MLKTTDLEFQGSSFSGLTILYFLISSFRRTSWGKCEEQRMWWSEGDQALEGSPWSGLGQPWVALFLGQLWDSTESQFPHLYTGEKNGLALFLYCLSRHNNKELMIMIIIIMPVCILVLAVCQALLNLFKDFNMINSFNPYTSPRRWALLPFCGLTEACVSIIWPIIFHLCPSLMLTLLFLEQIRNIPPWSSCLGVPFVWLLFPQIFTHLLTPLQVSPQRGLPWLP